MCMLFIANSWRNQGTGDAAVRRAEADRKTTDWTADPVFTEPDVEPDFSPLLLSRTTQTLLLASGPITLAQLRYTNKKRGKSKQIVTQMKS